MDNKTKFKMGLVRYRHEEQAKLSIHLGNVDNKIFIGFITLQITIMGFIFHISEKWSVGMKIVLLVIDAVLCLACSTMLYYHSERRKEVTRTIKNCNEYLGYSRPGKYLRYKAINAPTQDRRWFWLYILTIVALFVMFGCILFVKKYAEPGCSCLI